MNGNTLPSPFADFIVGVNYMPREHGCQMWSDWSEAYIKRDFKQIHELGLNTVRTFLFWHAFQPLPDVVSLEAVAKFDKLLEIARQQSIRLIPTFFTGHMSGENFDVAWRRDRDPFDDPFILKSQAELVRFFAERYASNDAILCWDLANEHDNLARPRDCYSGWLWTHTLYRELKAFDPTHPVTIGTHITSLEEDKLRLDLIAADFLCTHPYPMYARLCEDPIDAMRSTLFPAFTTKLSQSLGNRRVMLEEFGTTTAMTSEEACARFYQSVLYSALINDTIGVLAWCFTDYVIPERVPYKTTPHELEFGVVRRDGSPKKQALTLQSFVKNVQAIRYESLTPEKPPAAIVLPRRYYGCPDVSPDEFLRSLFNSFILAKQANVDVDFIRPQDPFDYDLIILPCVPLKGYLDTPDWEKVKAYVADGGRLYCSYHGMAVPGTDDLFGVEVVTQRSVSNPEVLYLNDLENRRENLKFATVPAKALCVRAREGKVVAWDEGRQPCVVTNEFGAGLATLVTQPLEYFLAFSHGLPKRSYVLYRMACRGLEPPIQYNKPSVEAKLFHREDGELIIFVNLDNSAVEFDVKLAFEHTGLQGVTSERSARHKNRNEPYKISLEANGYAIYRAT